MSLTVASAQLRGQPLTPDFTLCGVCRPSHSFSISMPEADRVAEAEAAELRADAGLHRAHGLRVRVPGRHAEVAPDLGQVLLADAEQVQPLAAGDLHERHLVLVGDVGDPAQLVGRAHAAVHPRHDRERAVLLDVRVDAVVDEARVALLLVAVGVDLGDEVGERRLADAALAPGAARVGDLADGLQAVVADAPGELLARLLAARAQVGRLVRQPAGGGGDDLDDRRRGTTRSRCRRA